jgi:beta-barrel assembly-enhancing protease
MHHVRSLAALVFAAILVSACGSGGIGGGSSVSLDQEWQLGDQLAAQVQQQVKLVRDPQALAYVRSVGERLHAQTPLANRPFDFEIISDPSINAFSLPGGHVYVNTGLIAQMDKADELAAVMAHEISHVAARHAIKQVEQQQQMSIIGSILLGQNPSAVQQILAQILAGGATAQFSRADEKQADDMGLDLMYRAGYDPQGMLDMFQRLLSLEKSRPGSVSRFFADHPGTTDRIKDIQGRMPKYPAHAGMIVDEPAFHDLKQRV